MSTDIDVKKMQRTLKINLAVQVLLVLLLIYVALLFQASLGSLFWKSIFITLAIQLVNFYPINFFAGKEAKREVASLSTNLSQAEFKSLRTKRIIGEVIKMSVFAFFLIFALTFKGSSSITATRFTYSLIFFNFILTYLTFYQCFNFAARREMKAVTGS